MKETELLHGILFEWNEHKQCFTRREHYVATIGNLPIPKGDFRPYVPETTHDTKE